MSEYKLIRTADFRRFIQAVHFNNGSKENASSTIVAQRVAEDTGLVSAGARLYKIETDLGVLAGFAILKKAGVVKVVVRLVFDKQEVENFVGANFNKVLW